MTLMSDMLHFPVMVVSSVFSILGSVTIDGVSILDIILAFMYMAVTVEFIFSLYDVDLEVWSYIFDCFGDEDDE